jgi:hypothetical protein
MSAHYFDWKTIEEDVVIPEQAAIAVYNNPAGGIVCTGQTKTPPSCCIPAMA